MTIETIPETRPLEPTRERTVADVLREAARIIEEFGWWQSGNPDRSYGHCAMTAVSQASNDDDALSSQALYVLRRSLGLGRWPDAWNDEPDRTEAEVIAALRNAADQAEAAS